MKRKKTGVLEGKKSVFDYYTRKGSTLWRIV